MPDHLQLLPVNFYTQDSLTVGPGLIGCVIEARKDGMITSGKITETEAYPSYDAASHTFEGKRTPRTEIQYSEGGKLYIYQIMGVHLMTSVVVGEEDTADVVFIRSIEPIDGIEIMRTRRAYASEDPRRLASGPGVLSVALGITKNDNGTLVYDNSSKVRIFKDIRLAPEIGSGLRINLGIHGKDIKQRQHAIQPPGRFFEKNSSFLSK